MTVRSYLWGMRISTLLSFLAWLLVVWQVDPNKAGTVGQMFFYLTTLFFLAGLFILLFTWSRTKFSGESEIAFAYLSVSFRQGILLALLTVLILFLQSHRVLTWWDGLLVVAGICLAELYFLAKNN